MTWDHRLLVALALAGVFGARAGAAVVRESPWSIRIGATRSSLEGALGGVYPNAALSGGFGAGYRAGRAAWRLRTGLGVASWGGGVILPVSGFSIHEEWRTTWLEAPIVLERPFGQGRVRPYAGVGCAAAWRIPEDRQYVYEVPPEEARRLGADALASAGLEWRVARRAVRAEAGFAKGLTALYDSGKGPGGSWGAWTLALDVSL